MTVSTVASAASGAIQRLQTADKQRYTASIKSLIAASQSGAARSDITSFSATVALQAQLPALRNASLAVAQNSSAVEKAATGLSDLASIYKKMQSLAKNVAEGAVAEDADAEFQALRGQAQRVVAEASFLGRPLLDGTESIASLGIEEQGDLPDLRENKLLPSGISLNPPSKAEEALKALEDASRLIAEAQDRFASIAEALSYGASAVESALQNMDAARSSLNDSDVISTALSDPTQVLQSDTSSSLQAQTNRMPDTLLQLLS